MRCLIIALLLYLISLPAYAAWDDNYGYTYKKQSYGGGDHYTDSYGNTASCYQYGNQTYCS